MNQTILSITASVLFLFSITSIPAYATESGPERKRKSAVQRHLDICMSCHWVGALDAPRFGSKKEWAPRIAKGIETLYEHAIHGFNSMPPKGTCEVCSEEDVKELVDYIVKKSQ
ncbi:MAG: cytochrome c5 family protein [Pseudomonadales bacterium]|nr:cytochrome c5 family protein [Pseudomonadales bacterium]RLU02136.1 MAG: cytochrome c5 family protein [Ketobacter sp.]